MNHFKPPLKPNQVITNQEICEIFKVAPRGGMRRSKKTNTLVIISDPTREKYSDRWEGNVLHYTGMGLISDQSINAQQNKTLNESNLNDVDVHLFEVKTKGKYIYRGKVNLFDKPYQEKQRDDNGNLRNVWMFPLKLINSQTVDTTNKYFPTFDSTSSYTGYWTFYSNPKKWQIDRFLETNNEYDTYQVTPWQKHLFKPGQLGVIRVGVDGRTKKQLEGRKKLIPGIYAIVEVISEATLRESVPDKYWLEWRDEELKKPIVQIRILKNLLSKPLILTSLSNNETIEKDKYLIKGFQASSMPLEKKAFEEIVNLIDEGEVIFEKIEPSIADTMDSIKSLEEKYKNATPQVKAVISKRIERGPLAQKLKKIAQYKCLVCEQLDQDPHTFQKPNGEYFIEAHHVIQVVEKSKGVLGVSNIMTICPNHHRQLHYGNSILLENNDKIFKYKIDGKEITINKLILK